MGKNNKRNGKLLIPPLTVVNDKDYVYLTSIEQDVLGFVSSNREKLTTVSVSLKYYDSNFECFSKWGKTDLKSFSAFIKKLGKRTWDQVKETGGKIGDKTGLGYTPHKDKSKLPTVPEGLSEDIDFCELRVTQKARVHGFHLKSVFFLVWLDQNHKMCPM